MQLIFNKKLKIWREQAACIGILVILTFFVFPMAICAQPDDTQKNKKLVEDFFTLAFVDKKVEEAFNMYVGDNYIQHDPNFPDKNSTIESLTKLFSNPQIEVSVKRVIAENNLVALHLHSKNSPEDIGVAIIEIFRVDGGKIVEHWSVMQSVPEKSANENTMF